MSDQPVPVKARPKEEPIPLIGSLLEIAGLVFLLVLFNQYPEWIRFWISSDQSMLSAPLLAPTFFVHLPLFNLLWGLSLATAVVKAVYQRWTPALRAADIGLAGLSIYVLWQVVSGGPIVNTAVIPDFFDTLVRLGLGIVIVLTAVSIIPKLRDLLRSI